MLKKFRRTTPPTKIFLHRNYLANTPDQVPVEKIASSIQSAVPGRRDQREKYPTNVNGQATRASKYLRTHVRRSNISYRKYFVAFIIQCRKYFVLFNFVVLSDYENISTTKIS